MKTHIQLFNYSDKCTGDILGPTRGGGTNNSGSGTKEGKNNNENNRSGSCHHSPRGKNPRHPTGVWRASGQVGISRRKDGGGRDGGRGHRPRNPRGPECGDSRGKEGMHGGV